MRNKEHISILKVIYYQLENLFQIFLPLKICDVSLSGFVWNLPIKQGFAMSLLVLKPLIYSIVCKIQVFVHLKNQDESNSKNCKGFHKV